MRLFRPAGDTGGSTPLKILCLTLFVIVFGCFKSYLQSNITECDCHSRKKKGINMNNINRRGFKFKLLLTAIFDSLHGVSIGIWLGAVLP
ncbi:hypothetical protein DTO96_100992 [Ephemeroptericola cinctiostellae]|uniref:Uncharacterized protein n=1 Tax=Ephemeroptericola cinctiostellae TaxID=2268024 RepID=A0A345DA78_9BURK|nr:hypothetical protein DTO96_100992 [Ephemeroptericola cinctiostellae]